MLICTTWKVRPLSPEQLNRMMAVWAQIEQEQDAHPGIERVCWYMYGDGSGGFNIDRVTGDAATETWGLQQMLALGEFLEFDSRQVHDLESVMPALTAAMERING